MSAAPFNAAAERQRLLTTIAISDEAMRIAADHRSARHAPGETIAETSERWTEAAAIETTAAACRKAARAALAAIAVFPDVWSDEEIAAKIEAARSAALALKAACDCGQHGHAARMERLAPVRRNWRKISKEATE